MGKKLTSFSVNRSVLILEQEILKKTGLSKAVYHQKAVEYLYTSGEYQIHPRLLLGKSDPLYVQRDAREQVYISEEMRRMLKEIADLNGCSIGVVFFHALLIYSNIQYKILSDNL